MQFPRSALVTGASGFIGGHLADYLREQGVQVRVLVRDPRRWHGVGADVALGDLNEPSSLRAAVRDVEHVYHVAGVTKAAREADFYQVNHLGTVRLLQACRQENPALRRFVLVSSQAAAGPARGGRPTREGDPARPVSPYGWSKRRAEQAALAFACSFPVTIIRPPVVYGPRDRDTLLVFRLARYGIVPDLGPGHRFSIVHVRDLVRGICLAARHPRASGHVYFMANPEPTALQVVAEEIANHFGAPRLRLRVPLPLLWVAALGLEGAARFASRPSPITRNKVREASQLAWVCDSSRAADELGWAADVPLEVGVRETADWYRRAGWL